MKQLRPYQEQAIEVTLACKEPECTVVKATGLGKTVFATRLSTHYASTLFTVDSEELVAQARDAFREIYPEVGLIKAETFDLKPVTVASIQTLHRRLHLIPSDYFELQVVDEAHLYMAKTFRKGVEHFKPKLRCAITATPTRMDNLPLSDIFGEVIFNYGIRDGIRDGYLVELDAIRVKTNISLDKVGTVAGELNQGQLSNEINTLARNNLIADSYLKYANSRRTIVFCCSIKHAMDLCDAFLSKGIKATAISADEKLTGDRTQKVKDFKEGKYDVILNCSILGKGFDLPIVSCIINAAPTKSRTRFLQGIGRGTRPLSGVIDGLLTAEERWKAIKNSAKKDCLIIDITDNTTRHNLVNCYTEDLGLDPEDRVFITQENRDKLLAERLKKIHKLEFERKEDEVVKLLSIPRIKINFDSENMKKAATEPQLKWLRDLGYKTEENIYTHAMCTQIFGELPASKKDVQFAKENGYEVEGMIVLNKHINAIKTELWKKKQNKNGKTYKR